MVLNAFGNIAKRFWKQIPNHYKNVELDYSIVMPNHIHGIIILNPNVETRHAASLQLEMQRIYSYTFTKRLGVYIS